jgi:predicted phosphodiesterase
MVVNVSPRSATVIWMVQTDEAVLTAEGTGERRTTPILRGESATFNGLKAATAYDYSIPGHPELKGVFKTPPAAGQPYEFVVYGDTRTRDDVHRKVIAAVLQNTNPDFIVHTGDLVADGTDSSLWPVFFDIEGELLRKTVFFPLLGNHERNARDYYRLLQVPQYYSFNWGNAHFSILDSDIGTMGTGQAAQQSAWKDQVQWLEEDLRKNQKAEFRFVAAHHPPMTAVSNRQGSNPHMQALVPMFEQLHVTAAFFGHDHNYQHYLQNGIHYVITGGGGAPLYDVDKPPEGITVKVVRTENFARVQVDGKVAHVLAMAPDGTKLDGFDIEGAAH